MRFIMTSTAAALLYLLSAAASFAQPASAQPYADQALQFVQRGDLKNAEAELRKAVALAPEDASLLTSLGGVLGMEGNLRAANEYLAKAVKLNPKDAAARRNLAANQWQLGLIKPAQENLDRLLRADPNDKAAIFLSGMVAEKEKDYARSVKLLESVPDIMARQPDSWTALANGYYHTDQQEKARRALQHLDGPRSKFLGARVAEEAKDFTTAEALLLPVRATFDDPAALELEIARIQYRTGRLQASAQTLMDAIGAHHATQETFQLLCSLLHAGGDDVRALQFAGQSVRAYPDSAESLLTKASLELRLQYYNDAVASYQKADALQPSPEAETGLATAHWKTGDRERATSTFEQAMVRFPHDARLCETYGALLAEEPSASTKARAITLLKRALALNEAAVEPRYQLANFALAEDHPEEARAYLQKAIELNPSDSRLHFALSRVYRRLNLEAEAARETATYQKLKSAESGGRKAASVGR